MNIILSESQIERLFESVQNKVDNFALVADMLNITDQDKFYFVQIIKRNKDNRGMHKDLGNTYHAGGEYGNYAAQTAFKVRTPQDLDSVKQRIISYCDANNARAYITSNPRSESAISAFKPEFVRRQVRHNHGQMPPYANYAEEILAAQPKEGAEWTDRPRFFLDVDSNNPKVWAMTKRILDQYGVKSESEYATPSGGLHIVIPDRFSIQNIDDLIDDLRVFDNYQNLGRQQTVHANFDGKILLYANVTTNGY